MTASTSSSTRPSADPWPPVSRADQGPGLLDPGYPASIDNWRWGAFGASGIKGALYSGGPLVAPPPTMFSLDWKAVSSSSPSASSPAICRLTTVCS